MNITEVMNMIWEWLFDATTVYRTLPVWSAFASAIAFCSAALFMLWKKIRACEVVRGDSEVPADGVPAFDI